MLRIVKWALAAAAALSVLAAAAAGGLWLRLWTGLPSYAGEVRLAGPSAPVTVVRDGNAVPHVFARTMDDAYFALGWLHAQDRLFQMETMRRAGAGRTAELLGDLGGFPLRLDRMTRTLGLYRLAEAAFDDLSPEVRASLEAYAAGVNAWLAERDGPLPIEFQLLWHEPEPWRPADSLVWGKLMALQLSANWRDEAARAQLARVLPPDRPLDDLFPGDPPGGPTTLAALADWSRLAEALPAIGPGTASNEWALAPGRTATGGAILANDPHLGLDAPALWYLARIVTPDLELAGATVPGVPFHVLGRNHRIAWGATTTGGDVQDLVVERIDPADPGRYVAPDGSRPFAVREETIAVRFGDPVTVAVRETRNGPVVSDLADGRAPPVEPGHAVSLRFSALLPGDRTAEALWRLNRAEDWEGFRDAMRLFAGPQQNFVYADRDGRIGFLAPARVPVRGAGDGRLPVPGGDAAYDWTGFVPFDGLPQAADPPDGVFVNANNRIVGPDYPHLIAARWEDRHRAQRIGDVLREAPRQTVEGSLALQMDVRNLAALELLPLLLRLVEVDSGRVADATGQLRAWDGSMRRTRPEPLIFEHWLLELGRGLWGDELGPSIGLVGAYDARIVLHVLASAPRWCDDVRTPAAEDCAAVVRAALDRTLERLTARHGPHVPSWEWGAEHVAPLAHPVLGRLPAVGGLFRLEIPTDGGFYTVNRGATRTSDPEHPFRHVHGAGFRAVYDLADPARSRFVIATGQSGNPLSPHWGDFVRRWRDGGSVTLAGSADEVAAGGLGRLTILPAGR
jgi:penicillin amidase